MADQTLKLDSGNNPVEGAVSSVSGEIRMLKVGESTGALQVETIGKVSVTQGGGWSVSVSALPPLPPGGNFIGTVGIQALPSLPFGTNNIGNVGVTRLPALPAGSNNIGKVDVLTMPDIKVAIKDLPLAAGTAHIGSVNIDTMPAITLGALPAGANTIGNVNIVGSVPVTGSFWQATQPVSLASLPALPAGANTIGKVDVNGTVPVSGSFWQTTQPVSFTLGQTTKAGSLSVTLASDQGALPVSGTFWQATQPVSGTVGVSGSVAVTGTFWQATQPISATALPLPTGAATETTLAAINTKTPALGQALMAASVPVTLASNQSAVPVSGTFWQATQPVSIAAMPSTPVTGTFWQATQPVSLAAIPALVAGSAVIGKVGIDQTTPGTTNQVSAVQNGTWTVQPGNTPNTTPWLQKISDGTNAAAIKAASTAPVAADPALVVALSPNTPPQFVKSYLDPAVGALLTNVTANSTGGTITCAHAYKTFSFSISGTGTATITLYASADNTIFVPVATFAMDVTTNSADGLTTGATSHTKFYAVVSGITGSPTLNGTVLGVF